LHQCPEEIFFLLEETTQVKISLFVFNVLGQGNLLRGVATETVKLVHLSEFFHHFGRSDTITQFPSGAVVGFAKGKTNKTQFN